MNREELSNAAFKIINYDMNGSKTDLEIWKAIAETDDDSLEEFVRQNHGRLSNSVL